MKKCAPALEDACQAKKYCVIDCFTLKIIGLNSVSRLSLLTFVSSYDPSLKAFGKREPEPDLFNVYEDQNLPPPPLF